MVVDSDLPIGDDEMRQTLWRSEGQCIREAGTGR